MTISAIIPTLREEHFIEKTLAGLKSRCAAPERLEIIVADGGSDDRTCALARQMGAKVIHCDQASRAIQMNEGAAQAKGEVLYFIHADTLPPCNFDQEIDTVYTKGCPAGCFTSIFDMPHPVLRFFNWFSRLPFWFCRGGGQTLFIERRLFERLKGFDCEMRIMEEYEFIDRIKREAQFSVIPKNAITSARDYRVNGVLRLHLIYAYVFVLYGMGASQKRLLDVLDKRVRKARI